VKNISASFAFSMIDLAFQRRNHICLANQLSIQALVTSDCRMVFKMKMKSRELRTSPIIATFDSISNSREFI
jgi:hypothetical protein